MADVPVWVLIVQTLAAGGFGLAGSFIVPASQKETRRIERAEKAASIMREKAESIFAEIVAVREINNAAHVSNFNIVANKVPDTGFYNTSVFRSLDKLTGLISTYYPEGIDIIKNGRISIRKITDPMNEELVALGDDAISERGVLLRISIENNLIGSNVRIVDELEIFMIAAVKRFHPTS